MKGQGKTGRFARLGLVHTFCISTILLRTTPQADDSVNLTSIDGVEISVDVFVLDCDSRQRAE
jgi:hypothetical protein